MIPIIQNFPVIIVANGAFPVHEIPLAVLRNAEIVISCDGAAVSLLNAGIIPDYIVGDIDSLPATLKQQYADRLRYNPDQETNDLTKAVHFSVENGWNRIGIIGATGKREDHTLGNIALLAEYRFLGKVAMLTDYGVFIPISHSETFESFQGQQVSLFAITPGTEFSSKALKYHLEKRRLSSWWEGTLNEAEGPEFEIKIDSGIAIVFRSYPE